MSLDNGIYIGRFSDGWRVIHAQAIENIYRSQEDKYYYFSNARLFKSEIEALDYAMDLGKDIIKKGVLIEYGISSLGYLGELNAEAKISKYRCAPKTHKKK